MRGPNHGLGPIPASKNEVLGSIPESKKSCCGTNPSDYFDIRRDTLIILLINNVSDKFGLVLQ